MTGSPMLIVQSLDFSLSIRNCTTPPCTVKENVFCSKNLDLIPLYLMFYSLMWLLGFKFKISSNLGGLFEKEYKGKYGGG